MNKNRNPGVSREQCEEELGRLLGLKKIIWLPGIKGKDITDGHTDFTPVSSARASSWPALTLIRRPMITR